MASAEEAGEGNQIRYQAVPAAVSASLSDAAMSSGSGISAVSAMSTDTANCADKCQSSGSVQDAS